MFRTLKYTTLTILAMLAFCGCTGNFTYSSSPCYLVIDNSKHLDATLMTATTAASPGVFCLIRLNAAGNGFIFENNLGLSSTKQFNAIDQRVSHHLGMNNGLIVGFGTLTGEFYAYDRECPECFDPQSAVIHSRPVTMSSMGIATCNTCHSEYDMNNGGNCMNASHSGQRGLTRYRCGTTGPTGVLNVGN